jgi:hypothetical protein
MLADGVYVPLAVNTLIAITPDWFGALNVTAHFSPSHV